MSNQDSERKRCEKKFRKFEYKIKMTTENDKLQRGKLFAAAWRGDFDGVKSIFKCKLFDILQL